MGYVLKGIGFERVEERRNARGAKVTGVVAFCDSEAQSPRDPETLQRPAVDSMKIQHRLCRIFQV